MKTKTTLLATTLSFILATSCCWLPWLAVVFGSSAVFSFFSRSVTSLSDLFFSLGFGFLCYTIYLFLQTRYKEMTLPIVLISEITCPICAHKQQESMPIDACQYFYECTNCKQILKPNEGDCCVYCSFGTVQCPPMQDGEACC